VGPHASPGATGSDTVTHLHNYAPAAMATTATELAIPAAVAAGGVVLSSSAEAAGAVAMATGVAVAGRVATALAGGGSGSDSSSSGRSDSGVPECTRCSLRFADKEAATLSVGPYATESRGSGPGGRAGKNNGETTQAEKDGVQGDPCHSCGAYDHNMNADHQDPTSMTPDGA